MDDALARTGTACGQREYTLPTGGAFAHMPTAFDHYETEPNAPRSARGSDPGGSVLLRRHRRKVGQIYFGVDRWPGRPHTRASRRRGLDQQMEFDVFLCRREGRLLPRHVMWSTKVRGDLFISEEHDSEVHRLVRTATVRDRSFKVMAGPLHDAVIVSAKPDWWTMTGWERVAMSQHAEARAFQQSWILIPADRA